ncbi:TPA: hypothetical protein DEP58_00905 [Patescibacteria group bacterium]|nr:MAG: hypothetical protein UU98_C0007G0007 [Parcubacteria group bacterium GW2011_GWD2_42_14]HCC04848.1 hypothetical protein [Patescibacteria group bacterium]
MVKHSTLKSIKLLGSGMFLIGLLTLQSTCAHAQGGLAVKVQPSQIDEVVDAGQVLEGVLTVSNEEGGKQTYYIGTRNITGMSETGTPSFADEVNNNDPLEAAAWLKPSLESVTMEVGESVAVPYRIEVPTDASPGSYFAAFFVTREADKVTETGAGVGFHVASLVNLRVRGEINDDMLFREFFTEKAIVTTPSVIFKTKIENTGTIHQRPLGIINIFDMFGNEVGQVKFNETGGAILPRFDRVFDTTWEFDGFALGRYTAEASVLFGDTQKRTITKEVSFWVLPLKEIGIAFGALAIVLLTFIVGVRRYVRSMLKKAGQTPQSTHKSQNVSFAKRLVRTTTWILVILALLFIGMVAFFA